MSRPIRVNKQLAKTCPTCDKQILTAYAVNHDNECKINQFLAKVEKLKRLEIDNELAQMLKTTHGLPIEELRFEVSSGNGYMHAVYAPEWLLEGINIYHNTSFAGLTLGEFLNSLNPG